MNTKHLEPSYKQNHFESEEDQTKKLSSPCSNKQ